ncbi:glutaredoxin family protein [Bacillus sp. EB600]|uniref:glutaredoxin family protein n=1 Tax=Bacillus sp. EB600 TaxID=2806345 RepID=UPI002108C758|nr:glutaredoxin family protein [Bacillus sp. EB600]MCQ6278761.1 glutaredoxin family protein [Bacillus sp. EB600]
MPQTTLTLYTRQQCHLCEQAKQAIMELKDEYLFHLEEFDIDQNDELTERYGLMIPVVLINGEEVAFGQINKFILSNRLQKKF